VFIDAFVGRVDLRAIGDDKWESYPLRTWPLALQKNGLDPERTSLRTEHFGGRLLLYPAVKRPWNINRGTNGFLFHGVIIACLP
jgi:hypothetical protein